MEHLLHPTLQMKTADSWDDFNIPSSQIVGNKLRQSSLVNLGTRLLSGLSSSRENSTNSQNNSVNISINSTMSSHGSRINHVNINMNENGRFN